MFQFIIYFKRILNLLVLFKWNGQAKTIGMMLWYKFFIHTILLFECQSKCIFIKFKNFL